MTKVTRDEYEPAKNFHGHKCPAMPLGIRAGRAAMEALGVSRAQDKELRIRAETGKDHAAGCFLDGLMFVTGCTYGKSNIEKLYYDKMAFTLVDVANGREVRVRLKDEFFANMLKSPIRSWTRSSRWRKSLSSRSDPFAKSKSRRDLAASKQISVLSAAKGSS